MARPAPCRSCCRRRYSSVGLWIIWIGRVRQRDDRKQDGHDARDRTIRGALAISVMSVVGAKAENICSQRVFRVLTVQRSELPFQRVQVPPTEGDPATVVVISSNGEGDRAVESLEVKVPEGWAIQSDPYRGASNLAGRSGSQPVKPRNGEARVERIAGVSGVPSRWSNGEGHVGIEVLEHIDVGLPGVGEDGMPGRNVQ